MVPPDQLIMPFVQQLESSFRENLDQERARADRAEAKLNLRTIDLENERRVNRSLEARTRQVVRYQPLFSLPRATPENLARWLTRWSKFRIAGGAIVFLPRGIRKGNGRASCCRRVPGGSRPGCP